MKQGKEKKRFFTIPQAISLVAVGVLIGHLLVYLSHHSLFQVPEKVSQESKSILAPAPFYSRAVYACSAYCYAPPEKVPEVKKQVGGRALRPSGITRLADLPKKIKNPNAIRISLTEAPPILAEVKMVNGRPTCAKKNDKGHKSDKYKHVHIDQQCCLDPDEIPNPRCLYL